MECGVAGKCFPTVAGGVAFQAFLPLPLPPQPALELGGKLQTGLNEALIALGRLDAITTLLTDANISIQLCA